MLIVPLAVSEGASTAIQLGPLALIGLLYARRARDLRPFLRRAEAFRVRGCSTEVLA